MTVRDIGCRACQDSTAGDCGGHGPIRVTSGVATDKGRKAHGEEVDISNVALLLRIVALEQKVAYLMRQVDSLQSHPSIMRIGGGADTNWW